MSGEPQQGSVAHPRSGSATSASMPWAVRLLSSPAPSRGPELQPHRSLPRRCGQPPVRSSCPATLFLFPHFLTGGGGGGAARGRLEAQAEDHRAYRRLPLTGAEDWQDTELHGVQGAGGDKPSLAAKREPQARVKSCQADTRPACTGICTPVPVCLSFPNNFSEFHLLAPLASLTS